jgi:hypothetical protein
MSPHETSRRIVLVMVGTLALSGLLRLGPAVVMLGMLAASLTATARLAWVWKRDGQTKTGWAAWSAAWRPATLGFLGVLVLNGLHALFGSAALPIGVAAAITALVAFVVLRQAPDASGGNAAEDPASTPRMPTAVSASDKPPSPVRRPDADAAPPMPALPTPALCWEWRRSYLAVTRASKPDELTRIVALRAAYLDELERRDPTGFRRWLDSGARAASDPGRYLTSG